MPNSNKYPPPWSIVDLFLHYIPPIQFIVEMIIPVGLTILAGAPKTGKSFLCLMIAIAVGLGKKLFNSLETQKVGVLYLALEDSKNTIKARASKMVSFSDLEPTIHFRTTWKSSFDKNLKCLDDFLSDHPEVGLVIIDTFSKFCASDKKGSYASEYAAASGIKSLADKHGAAIVVTHHTTKTIRNDWISSLYGTHGVVGAADSVLFLDRQRGSKRAMLRMTGRNVETSDIGLRFNSDSCIWEVDEDEAEIDIQPERMEIIMALRSSGRPMRLSDIANAVGKSKTNTQNLLKKLMNMNLVEKVSHGVYSIPSVKKSVDSVDSMDNAPAPVNLMDSVNSMDYRYHWS